MRPDVRKEVQVNDVKHESAGAPLAGRVALVTGGGRGLGEAICEDLARHGAHVIVADLDGDRAAAVAQRLERHGGQAVGRPLDVRDEASVLQVVHDAREALGDLDVIVNNAAIDVTAPIDDVSVDAWRQVLMTNLLGPY
ncbi:SDR family NAD(P)-dependent oxidoreductase, partial [Burkholderia contaminans]|uniref:SDR family NAD(P)-dependent oxidoreductase n=1 Tax=Burkholderia contaminans TaxID=488447 RepID=UPI002D8017A2